MANEKNITAVNIQNLRDKSAIATYGTDNQLTDESKKLKQIIQQSILDTKRVLGDRMNGKPINYFNEINFGNAFNELFTKKDTNDGKETDVESARKFKEMMLDSNLYNADSIFFEDQGRTVQFSNYRIIRQHIPECAHALEIYKDNIMSPDDFTKLIFNINYNSEDKKLKERVEEEIKGIEEKYQIEKKADLIIDEALTLGEAYYAVLSLDDELSTMLSNMDGKKSLNEEQLNLFDKDVISAPVLSESIDLTNDEKDALNEYLGLTPETGKDNTKELKEWIANLVNQNVQLESKNNFLLERLDAIEDDKAHHLTDIPDKFYEKNQERKSKKKEDNEPLYLNGSTIRRLAPERVCELRVDEICYGYYYAEAAVGNPIQGAYLGSSTGRNVGGIVSVAQNNTFTSTTGVESSPNTTAAAQLGLTDQKYKIISNLLVNCLSKKLDKKFIRENPQFKDFIFELVRQEYIIKKGLRLTYFKPDEVIKFECDSVYKDITFFAKLYMSVLINDILIKIGRAHDKRVFYVQTGLDQAYEEAINQVIQDIKTKEYKLDGLNDFNTILNLSPGRFDDYFIPQAGGERSLDIETLPGMDTEMDNEFVTFLKNSMMSGMGVPRNLIDVTAETDFARNISAMNANFVRSVIRYQKAFTPSFNRFYQKLYKNEFRFAGKKERNDTTADFSCIQVKFPSPATLAISNITDMLQSADAVADLISSQIVTPKPDGSNEEDRAKLKSEIIKDYVPSIDWKKYEDIYNTIIKTNKVKDQIMTPTPPQDDMYGAGPGMGY